MAVAVVAEAMEVSAAEDAQASAAALVRASAAVPVQAELVVPTAEPELAVLAPGMARGLTHPESQRDATAAIAAMAKGTTRREPPLEGRFTVLVQGRKAGRLPGSLLGRQNILAAITPPEINRGSALPEDPTSSPVIIREQIGISGSNAPLRLQGVQRDQAALGRDRI